MPHLSEQHREDDADVIAQAWNDHIHRYAYCHWLFGAEIINETVNCNN